MKIVAAKAKVIVCSPGIDIDEALAAEYPSDPAYLPTARKLDGTVHSW